jgi:hypothetical protein
MSPDAFNNSLLVLIVTVSHRTLPGGQFIRSIFPSVRSSSYANTSLVFSVACYEQALLVTYLMCLLFLVQPAPSSCAESAVFPVLPTHQTRPRNPLQQDEAFSVSGIEL